MAGVDRHKQPPRLLNRERSDKLYADALGLMPGGVSSPVRSFNAVGSAPFFAASGSGAEIVDVDGNRYIDLVQSWGALLFGHAHPAVVDAVTEAARKGTSFGTPSELEVELARLVTSMVPGAERVRFVSSGTEAGMTAVRLARGITKRNKIVKFEGCYHGHSDALLASAGSGMATLGIPGTPGVTPAAVADTIVVPYNDTDALDAVIAKHGAEVAAILVEPVAANMGLVLPREGWLADVALAAKSCGALLIFDEVITGFRLDPGGAQERFAIEADLVMLGKILGGGLPAAAVAGRASIMDELAPDGPVYQAGTLSGNPLAMAAGIATLGLIRSDPGLYQRLQETGRSLARAFVEAAEHAQVYPMVAASIGALSGFFFSEDEVDDFRGAQASDGDAYARFFAGMLSHGVYLPPSRFEALFVSAALTDEHIDRIAHAAAHVLTEI
ncbi:MAG TPA: glutamate-1-semialdehyde 2,1-aminomutase [Actinomycetota bacterium]|nr:glutamate-1-semialdehyde 2,1-aminomutase [Actinomycetota bacterium]